MDIDYKNIIFYPINYNHLPSNHLAIWIGTWKEWYIFMVLKNVLISFWSTSNLYMIKHKVSKITLKTICLYKLTLIFNLQIFCFDPTANKWNYVCSLLNTMDHLKLNCKNDMWMVLVLFRSNPTSPPIFHSFLYYY
jgi:hypothetical protein